MSSASVKSSLLTTISRKLVMAVTGLFLCSFLVVHLGGNLLLLLPEPEARILFNTYAATLSGNPLIKAIAYGLYAAILVHVGYAVWIAVMNRRAAGSRYAVDRRAQASPWYARQMNLLGAILLVFLVVHMRDLWFVYRFGAVPLDAEGHRDLYELVVTAFRSPVYTTLHVGAFVTLGYHLRQGVVGALGTLGLYDPLARRIAVVVATIYSLAISAGFIGIALVVHVWR